MNVGIIAHNSKKPLIEDFCIAYKNILAKHEVYATGTTGRTWRHRYGNLFLQSFYD